jgi:hypothetical protein
MARRNEAVRSGAAVYLLPMTQKRLWNFASAVAGTNSSSKSISPTVDPLAPDPPTISRPRQRQQNPAKARRILDSAFLLRLLNPWRKCGRTSIGSAQRLRQPFPHYLRLLADRTFYRMRYEMKPKGGSVVENV